ncbi:MAG: Hsp20/alpha crystallin family protein [Planctomycetota bacterium]
MRLTKWEPKTALQDLHDEFDRMVDRFFGNGDRLETTRTAEFTPTVDIVDRKNELVVRAELPGIDAKDVEVTCEGTRLTLTGEKKHEVETKGQDFYRYESQFGKFQRVLTLPSEVEAKLAKATYKNGVLEIVLPKSEEAKAKEVKIKIG